MARCRAVRGRWSAELGRMTMAHRMKKDEPSPKTGPRGSEEGQQKNDLTCPVGYVYNMCGLKLSREMLLSPNAG